MHARGLRRHARTGRARVYDGVAVGAGESGRTRDAHGRVLTRGAVHARVGELAHARERLTVQARVAGRTYARGHARRHRGTLAVDARVGVARVYGGLADENNAKVVETSDS